MRQLKRVVGAFNTVYFKCNMFLHGIAGLPAQTKKEREIFKTVFGNLKSGGKLRIFEWGSGFSTIYYADYLRRNNRDFEWHAIDNNRIWHEKVNEMSRRKGLEKNVFLHLSEFPPFWKKPGWGAVPPPCGVFGPKTENEKAYIELPRKLAGMFDVIIVDARFRRHCLKTAKETVLPEGVVIMHDAQKEHYHTGMEDFANRRFFSTGSWHPFQALPNKVWIGSPKNSRIFEALKDY